MGLKSYLEYAPVRQKKWTDYKYLNTDHNIKLPYWA